MVFLNNYYRYLHNFFAYLAIPLHTLRLNIISLTVMNTMIYAKFAGKYYLLLEIFNYLDALALANFHVQSPYKFCFFAS